MGRADGPYIPSGPKIVPAVGSLSRPIFQALDDSMPFYGVAPVSHCFRRPERLYGGGGGYHTGDVTNMMYGDLAEYLPRRGLLVACSHLLMDLDPDTPPRRFIRRNFINRSDDFYTLIHDARDGSVLMLRYVPDHFARVRLHAYGVGVVPVVRLALQPKYSPQFEPGQVLMGGYIVVLGARDIHVLEMNQAFRFSFFWGHNAKGHQ